MTQKTYLQESVSRDCTLDSSGLRSGCMPSPTELLHRSRYFALRALVVLWIGLPAFLQPRIEAYRGGSLFSVANNGSVNRTKQCVLSAMF